MQQRTHALALVCSFALIALISAPLQAQWWLDVPAGDIPRLPNGAPDLEAPAPRTSEGKPDLSGIWYQDSNRWLRNIAADMDPDDVPFQPWAKELAAVRATGAHSREDPDANCLPQGIPKLAAAPAPWKLVQTPDLIVVLHEAFTLWRQIFLDGRRLADNPNPSWIGYSTGTWDGDTLVVESRGFNGKIWLDQLGKPSTEQLHVIERYRRKDYGHMEIEITLDDPGAFTRPWNVTETFHLLPDTELLEFICNENNRDLVHLPSASDQ
jgi:hypothetical protein